MAGKEKSNTDPDADRERAVSNGGGTAGLTGQPVHKKAAFYFAKGVRSIGNHRLSVNVDVEKFYRQASESTAGRGMSKAWGATKKKTNDGVRWARTYSEEMRSDGIVHREGESFLRTERDMRDKFRRGDLITIDGETFMISKDESDEFSGTKVTLRSPREGRRPGVRIGKTTTTESVIKRVGDRFSEVGTTITASKFSNIGDVAVVGGGAVVGAVKAAGGAAIAAADYSLKTGRAVHNKARYYEEIVGQVEFCKEGSNVLKMKKSSQEHASNVSKDDLEVLSTKREIPDILVSMKQGENFFEPTESLVGKLDRGSTVMIQGEVFTVSSNYLRRFSDAQVPVDSARLSDSVSLVPLFAACVFKGCVKVEGLEVSLAQGSNTMKVHGKPKITLKRGDVIVVEGERYTVSTNLARKLTAKEVPLETARVGSSVLRREFYIQDYSNVGFEVPDILITLPNGSAIGETTGSCEGILKRGDTVYIAGEEYKVSMNPLKRFTADRLPLDRVRVGCGVELVPFFGGRGTGAEHSSRKLQRGDRIRVGSQEFVISTDVTRPFFDGDGGDEIPLCDVDGVRIAYTNKALNDEPVVYIGDRLVDAAKNTAVVAHRAGVYKEEVGIIELLVKDSVQMYTSVDLRRWLKRGDYVLIGTFAEKFQISDQGEYSAEMMTLDRAFPAKSIANHDRPVNNLKATKFEKNSRICYVNMDPMDVLSRGDRVKIGDELYTISKNENDLVNSSCITMEKPRTKASIITNKTNKVIEDCLISLEKGAKYATTTSSITAKVSRGDSIVIGSEEYVISTNILRRFTATTVPLERPNEGESVDLEEVKIAYFSGDCRIFWPKSIEEVKLYRLGDRVDDLAKDKRRIELRERKVWREREDEARIKVDRMKAKGSEKLDDLSTAASQKHDKFKEAARPKVEMVAGAAYVTGQKIGQTMEPVGTKLRDGAHVGYTNIKPKLETMGENIGRSGQKLAGATASVLKDLKDGAEEGIDAGTGPVKRHEINIRAKAYGGTKK